MGNSNFDRLINRISVCTFFLALTLLSLHTKAEAEATSMDTEAETEVVETSDREPAQAKRRRSTNRQRKSQATKPAPQVQPVAPPAAAPAAPADEKSPYSASFEFTIGEDDNVLGSRGGVDSTFYQFKPGLGVATSAGFLLDVGVSILDFTDEDVSENAKETEAGLGLGYKTKLFGETDSTSKFSIVYSDSRAEDEINGTPDGMAVQSTTYKFEQKLGWDFGGMKVNAGGLYEINNGQSINKFAPDLFGTYPIEADYKKAAASVTIAIPLTDAISIEAVPAISHKVYDEQKGRETNGSGSAYIPGSPDREYLDNELAVNVPMNFGPINITPSVVSGITSDRANGGEDHTFIKGQIATAVKFEDLNNLNFAVVYWFKSKTYDNWTHDIVPSSDKREDDDSKLTIGANIDVLKNFNVGVNWSHAEEDSNMDDSKTWENYTRDTFAAVMTLKF